MFDPREKIAVLIDGANLYSASPCLGFRYRLPPPALRFPPERLPGPRHLLHRARRRAGIFLAPAADRLARLQRLPRRDEAAKEFTDAQGRRKVKGNMDIELAVDAMEMAEYVDHFVLFSGDGDFRSSGRGVAAEGQKVTVASTIRTQPPMIADDLRRQADHFLELSHARRKLGRDPDAAPAAPVDAQSHEEDEDEFEEL